MPLRLIVWTRLSTGPLARVATVAPGDERIPIKPPHWLVPRYRPEVLHRTVPLVAVQVLPTTLKRNTQTMPRMEAQRFCFQCGALIPPWRDDCARHDGRRGQGLPPPLRLVAAPVSCSDIDTAEQPIVRLSA